MIKKAKGRSMGFLVWLFVICLGIIIPASGSYASPVLDDRDELEAFISKIIGEQLAEQGGLLLIALLLSIFTLVGWTTAYLWRHIKGRKGDVPPGARLARWTVISFPC